MNPPPKSHNLAGYKSLTSQRFLPQGLSFRPAVRHRKPLTSQAALPFQEISGGWFLMLSSVCILPGFCCYFNLEVQIRCQKMYGKNLFSFILLQTWTFWYTQVFSSAQENALWSCFGDCFATSALASSELPTLSGWNQKPIVSSSSQHTASWFTLHPKCLGPSGLHVTAAKSQDLHFTLMALHTDFNQTLSSLSSTISFMTHSTTFSSQLSPSSRSLLCVYISGHSLLKLLFFWFWRLTVLFCLSGEFPFHHKPEYLLRLRGRDLLLFVYPQMNITVV